MRLLAATFLTGLCCAALASPPGTTGTQPEIEVALAAPGRDPKDLERDARDQPAVTLGLLGLTRGMRVLDAFGGGGYYAELAARVVGESGRVHLHNNDAYLSFAGKALDARLAARPLPQLVRYDREVDAIELENEIDVALLVMAYHDAYWKPKEGGWTVTRDPMLSALYRVLRPGGRLLVVDHSALPGTGSSAAQELHRIEESFARADFERAGFRLVGTSDALRNPSDDRSKSVFDPAIRGKTDRFVLVFEKPSPPAG
jgi:predicted methyltransferase